jgi:hypothetical protein
LAISWNDEAAMYEMTRERFTGLAEAYGGQIARWPEAERDAAAALLAAEPEFAGAVLAGPSGLDEALDHWAPMPVRAELRAAVIGAAPGPRRSVWSWAMGLGLGAGLAGACASGVVAGAVLLGAFTDPGVEAVTAAMTSSEGLSVDGGDV